MTIKTVPGMKDILPGEVQAWQKIEIFARDFFARYHYQEIRTSLLETTELFVRGIGSETGVVQKEMYTFDDKGGDSVTLRPEGTASVIRAYIEHHLGHEDPVTKLFYLGAMFRYERPQKGRLRQFHQLGCELIGSPSPYADAEVIQLLDGFVRGLGLNDFKLEINSLGCLKAECRPAYLKKVKTYFEGITSKLCADCQRKVSTNPLRILDCKMETCRQLAEKAPLILEHQCSECAQHFKKVETHLKSYRVNYSINQRIVRGLDYYDRTAFELTSEKLGSQNAFAGGGRYSGLVKSLGGTDVTGIGFAIGLERLVMLVPEVQNSQNKLIYIASLGPVAAEKGHILAQELRGAGIFCEMDYEEKSLKAQLRRADKLKCSHVIILGDDEIKKGEAIVKDFKTQAQTNVSFSQLVSHFTSR